jgi:hypothetical protein
MLKKAKQPEPIPLFSCDGVRVDYITLARLAVLQELGRIARVVAHKKGIIGRAYLTRLHSEPRPTTIGSYAGTRNGFRQRLSAMWHIACARSATIRSDRSPTWRRTVRDRSFCACCWIAWNGQRARIAVLHVENVHRGARDAARANVGPSAADCASV